MQNPPFRDSYEETRVLSDSGILLDKETESNNYTTLKICSNQNFRRPYEKNEARGIDKKELLELHELQIDDVTCGLGSLYRPKWLQMFAKKEVYLLFYCLMGLTVGMFFSYSVATMTTFEKRFKITSQQSGIILSGNDVSQVLVSIVASYYINFGHRPRWLGFGMMCASLACFLAAFPHFIYGPGEDAIDLTTVSTFGNSNVTDSIKQELCHSPHHEKCSTEELNSAVFPGPAVLLFLCQFFIGIMTSIYGSVGFIYLDDNSDKKNSPLYLGYILMSITLLIVGGIIFFFPRELPETLLKKISHLRGRDALEGKKELSMIEYVKKLKNKQLKDKPSLKKLPLALKRLLTNKIWLGNAFSTTMIVLALSGLGTFLPKYYETQFRKSASEANIYLGVTGMASTLVGLVISGLFMKYVKPNPRLVTGYLWALTVVAAAGIAFLSNPIFTCPPLKIVGLGYQSQNIGSCWKECECTGRFEPVCGADNVTTYYSGCYAGCITVNDNYTPPRYENCACLLNGTKNHYGNYANIIQAPVNVDNYVTRGYCEEDCSAFFYYLIFISVMHLVMSTGRVGNTIVNLRAVKAEDKALSLGTLFLLISLIGAIPGPIIMGALLDATCLIWDKTCGSKGNCWLYDSDQMTVMLHTFPAVLVFLASFGDLVVFYYSPQLDLYGEKSEENEVEDIPLQDRSQDKSIKNSKDDT